MNKKVQNKGDENKIAEDADAKLFFSILETGMSYFDRISEKLVKNSILFKEKDLTLMLSEFYSFSQNVIEKNPVVYFQNAFHVHYLSEKLEIHNFTMNFLDFLDYAKISKNDQTFNKITSQNLVINSANLDDLNKNIAKSLDNLSVSFLPINWKEINKEFSQNVVNEERYKLYLQDYAFKLNQTYEIFIPISMFLLLLCQYTIEKPISKIKKKLQEHRKLSVNKIYFNPNKNTKDSPLLKNCLNKETQLYKFLDFVYGNHGVREIRNLITHYLGEKNKCEISSNGIKCVFEDSTSQLYSINDIQQIYGKLTIVSNLLYLLILRQQLNALYYIGRLTQKHPDLLEFN